MAKDKEIQTVEPTPLATIPGPAAVDPMALIQLAIQNDVDMDRLGKLLDLQERHDATQARKAYAVAMNAFKANPPTIFKNATVDFQGKTRTHYTHATLDHVASAITEKMSPHGLSFVFDVHQEEGGKRIKVTCKILHVSGHVEEVSLVGYPDQSGNKNLNQEIGSTVTYLSRYTLLSATGLATQGQDTDGYTANPGGLVSMSQVEAVKKILEDNGGDEEKLCGILKVGSLGEMTSIQLPQAMELVKRKKR